jgi:uncharacterized membrane protein YkgB
MRLCVKFGELIKLISKFPKLCVVGLIEIIVDIVTIQAVRQCEMDLVGGSLIYVEVFVTIGLLFIMIMLTAYFAKLVLEAHQKGETKNDVRTNPRRYP